MADMLVEARRLSKRYRRGRPAISDMDLSLPPGGVIGLVGPNGAGKSTFLRLCVGFEKPTTGEISVLENNPWADRTKSLSQLSYFAQSPTLFRNLSVADHLDFVAHYRGKAFDRTKAETRLHDLRVPLTAHAGTLSGGQASQVCLGIALGLRARLLLLDEPLAALDPLARREFIQVLLDDISGTGATVVLSSHIVSDLEQACGRLVVLREGRVQLHGTVDRLLATHSVRSGVQADEYDIARLPNGQILSHRSASTAGGSPATLDDIVLGYLSAGRNNA